MLGESQISTFHSKLSRKVRGCKGIGSVQDRCYQGSSIQGHSYMHINKHT